MFTPLKQTVLPVALTLILFFTSCSSNEEIVETLEPLVNTQQVVDEVASTTIDSNTMEIEILNLINDYRTSINLASMDGLNIIKTPALTHTSYMIEQHEISHENFNERAGFLIENANANRVAENVAAGFNTAKSVVDAWIASEGHKKNIEGDFNYFDIVARKDSNNRWYFTNIFIRKP